MATPPPFSTLSATAASPRTPPVFLDAAALRSLLPHSALIPHLRSTLPSLSLSIHSPHRQSFPISPSNSSSLLLMPSWSSSPSLPFVGVKIVTSFPLASPSISAFYTLFDSTTGAPLAALDGSVLTLLRTSAVSALASLLLSRPDSSVLVLAGAGALAPHLISAHRLVRPSLNRIIIWNRTASNARDLIPKLQEEEEEKGGESATFEHAEDFDEVVGLGDVVSCATRSEVPIVKGGKLKAGAHLDLVGSFTPAMRECDDEAVRRGRVFVDFDVAAEEAGELVGAVERGVIRREDVVGNLADLAGGKVVGRRREEEVTVFKSVGAAVVDLLAAQLAYENYLQGLQ